MNLTLNMVQAEVRRQIAVSSIPETGFLQHAVCGLTEEAGEVSGLLKREVYRQQEIPRDRWLDELGDVMWYLIATCEAKDLSLEDVFHYNRMKLEARYGCSKDSAKGSN